MIDHRHTARALERVLTAPRAHVLDSLSAEIGRLVPHLGAVMLTGACARAPVKRSGPAAAVSALTASRAHALLADAPPAGWTGEVGLGGADRRVLALPSAAESTSGAGLVLVGVPASTAAGSPGVRAVVSLWEIIAIALADQAEVHAAVLTSLLGTLRSERLDDREARDEAVRTASEALVRVRRDTEVDRALSAQPADEAFAVLGRELGDVARHHPQSVDLRPPDSTLLLARDTAQAARTVSRGALVTLLQDSDATRLRLSWSVDGSSLHIAVRDDGRRTHDAADSALAVLAERVAPLGGALEVDSDPHWGTTVTARIPLVPAAPEPPAVLADLTDRERQVLSLVARGLSNRAMADRLVLSEHTVKYHLHNILDKLAVSSRGEAAALARAVGQA
ncbi:LuxR C-terminal-related transcriptional regulator [Nocardiopsis sp. NPDC058631]|uniref:LuxR C-terminal-related transcriptional regulator n=1 Tax=Nocardiopsis sp. NPDC058631 TaxID=3346566 RepID=UPI0036678A07